MGAIFNAQANKSPVVVTAGQQHRSLMTLQANLTNRDAMRMPHPLVKWSYEPPRAEDVPHALARATHLAGLAPRGPVFVSIPMDDWSVELPDEEEVRHQTTRTVSGAALPGAGRAGRAGASASRGRPSPAFVAGPDIDASGGWDAAMRLAERQRLPVYATPATGGGRIGFPEDHPLFQGILPPAVWPVGDALAAHDLVLVAGSSVFPYYPNIPGALLAEGTKLVAITSDPDEAARAPMGDAIVADVALTLAALAELVERLRARGAARASRARGGGGDGPDEPLDGGAHARAGVPAGWHRGAGVPLGDARAAQPAAPLAGRAATTSPRAGASASGCRRRSACSWRAPIAPWCACWARARRSTRCRPSGRPPPTSVPVTFLVLRNDEYAILKWFGMLEEISGAPGLDLPALDCVAVAAATA